MKQRYTPSFNLIAYFGFVFCLLHTLAIAQTQTLTNNQTSSEAESKRADIKKLISATGVENLLRACLKSRVTDNPLRPRPRNPGQIEDDDENDDEDDSPC